MTRVLAGRAWGPNAQWLLTLGGVALVFLLSAVGSKFQMQQWSQWLIFSILALSFVWVWGHSGIFSFAQVAFFGLGAYGYGIFSLNFSETTGETATALVVGMLLAALLALLIGYFLFYGHVSDVYVSIATLAVSLVFYTLMSSTADSKYRVGDAPLGGFNGMIGIPSLKIGFGSSFSYTFVGKDLFLLVGVLAVLVALLVTVLRKTAFGRLLGAVRENEARAALLGVNVPKQKLFAFVVSGAIAGLAGGLYAAWGNFVDPTAFGLQMATLLAVWVVAGGRTSVVGAFVGVFLIQQVTNSIASTGSTFTPLILGAILIVIVLVIPRGIVPTAGDLVLSLLRRARRAGSGDKILSGAEGIPQTDVGTLVDALTLSDGLQLEALNVTKAFGGVKAVKDVSAEFGPNGVSCLIGPNGAGKSTLFQSLVGTHTLTRGKILLDGQEVTRRDASWRVRNGVSIKSQVPSLFAALSVRENLWVAAYATGHDTRAADEVTEHVLAWLGYEQLGANVAVEHIAHGKQQWLDIAMALAQRPRALFLDEPAAGMGRVESSRVAELARAVSEHIPVIVVEHDMEFVRQLDAPTSVLHQGEMLVTGTFDELRSNEQVQRVYLGRS